MSDRFMIRLTILVALILVVRLAASFLPAWRLWGFNQAAFMDYMIIIYPILIGGMTYVLLKKNKLASPSSNPATGLMDQGQGLNLTACIIFPVVCGLCFYLLRVKAHFLGDGLNLIANPEMSIKYRELGEVIIHRWLIRALGTVSSDSVLSAFRALSIASGILFTATLVFYGRRIAPARFEYWLLLVLVLFSANSLLFFGYVENYSITTAFIGITVISATASLKSGEKSLVPIAGFAVAVFLHSISLVYLPAVLFYVGLAFGGDKTAKWISRRSSVILIIMIMLFVLGYAVVRTWTPLFWRMAFLPPLGDRFTIDNYFLLSPNHLIDYVNLTFFLIPTTMVVWMLGLMMRGKRGLKAKRSEYLFLRTAAIFGLIAAFVLEPKLGMARDWDLMSTVLIGAGFYGIYQWVDSYNGQLRFKPASLILVILSLSIFVPWLALNNTTDALARYSMAVMKLDPRHSRPGLLTMGAYMEKKGNQAEAQRLVQWRDLQYPEIQLNDRGADYYNRGEYAKAESVISQAIMLNPSWFGLYLNLGMCQLKMGKADEALDNLKIADGLNPYNAYIYNFLGETYMLKGDTARAVNYWDKSIRGDVLVPEAYMSMGAYHLMNRRADSAMHYLSQVSDTRVSIDICYWKGLAAFMLNDSAAALENFNAYLTLGSDSAKIRNINRVKSLLVEGKTPREK